MQLVKLIEKNVARDYGALVDTMIGDLALQGIKVGAIVRGNFSRVYRLTTIDLKPNPLSASPAAYPVCYGVMRRAKGGWGKEVHWAGMASDLTVIPLAELESMR